MTAKGRNPGFIVFISIVLGTHMVVLRHLLNNWGEGRGGKKSCTQGAMQQCETLYIERKSRLCEPKGEKKFLPATRYTVGDDCRGSQSTSMLFPVCYFQ